MSAELSRSIVQFLSANVESWEQLDALLLLAATAPRAFDATEVAAALRLTRDAADAALAHLVARALVGEHAGQTGLVYSFAPADTAAAKTVAELRGAHANDQVGVVRLMNLHALDRARAAAAGAFGLIRRGTGGR